MQVFPIAPSPTITNLMGTESDCILCCLIMMIYIIH